MNTAENTKLPPIIDGQIAAQYFKFYLQHTNSSIVYPQQLNRIGYKTVYYQNKKIFDIAAEMFRKQQVDIVDYIKWFVLNQHYGIKDLKHKFMDSFIVSQYADSLKIKSQRKRIFKRFDRCAHKIAEECIRLNISHCVDYIKKLIQEKKLAAYYITGKVTKHFLAAIPKFQQIILKLDPLSRDEFHQIYSMFDTYHREIAEAMEQEAGRLLGPFSYVDQLIEEKRTKK